MGISGLLGRDGQCRCKLGGRETHVVKSWLLGRKPPRNERRHLRVHLIERATRDLPVGGDGFPRLLRDLLAQLHLALFEGFVQAAEAATERRTIRQQLERAQEERDGAPLFDRHYIK